MMKDEWEEFRDESLTNPAVAREYNKLLPVNIAVQLIRSRKAKGLTQIDLAKQIGTTQSVISQLESGSYRGYPLRTLEKIAEALDQTVSITFKPKTA